MAAREDDLSALSPSREERIELLFERHHQRLFGLALRMTGDREEARDLVQECFLRIVRSADRLPAGEPAGEAWSVRTLVNLCRDRRRRVRVREEAAKRIDSLEAIPSQEGEVVARRTLERAMAGLRPRRRAILILCELEERPVSEVADLLGLARATVRWHLAAARKSLSKQLQALEQGGSR